MDYTLFLDEAGPFKMDLNGLKTDPPWLIGGILVPSSKDQCEAVLRKNLENLIAQLRQTSWFTDFEAFVIRKNNSINSLPDKLRKHVAEVANSFGHPQHLHRVSYKKLFSYYRQQENIDLFPRLPQLDRDVMACDSIGGSPSRRLVAIHSGTPVSPDGINYAVLVQDVILTTLVELVGQHDVDSGSIEFVFERRKQDDQQLATHKLNKAFLTNAVACGMASLEMLDTFSRTKKPVHIEGKGISYGTAIADFVCGSTRDLIQATPPKDVTRILGSHQLFYSFSSATPMRRQSRIWEQKGNYGEAIISQLQSTVIDQQEVLRLTRRMISTSPRVGLRHSIELIIEKLDQWSRHISKRRYVKVLLAFDLALETSVHDHDLGESIDIIYESLCFRVKSYVFAWINHVGDAVQAQIVGDKLEESRKRLQADSHSQEALFQYEIGLVERAINDHAFELARQLSQEHTRSVKAFLGRDTLPTMGPSPHCLIRATSSELRSSALLAAHTVQVEELETVLQLAREEFECLRQFFVGHTAAVFDDLIRLAQVEGFCAEALGDTSALMSVSERLIDIIRQNFETSPYAHALLLRCLSSMALLEVPSEAIAGLLPESVLAFGGKLVRNQSLDHPEEIILREWLLLGFRLGYTSAPDLSAGCEVLNRWLTELRMDSEVFRHQARVAKAVRQLLCGIDMQEVLSISEVERYTKYIRSGIGKRHGQILAMRATTIY